MKVARDNYLFVSCYEHFLINASSFFITEFVKIVMAG